MHRRLMEDYQTDEERLAAVRRGIPPRFTGDAALVGTNELRERFMGWAENNGGIGSLVLNFEDIVGSRGGGSHGARKTAIGAILRHLDLECSEPIVNEIDSRSAEKKSFTFRSGKIGSGAQSA